MHNHSVIVVEDVIRLLALWIHAPVNLKEGGRMDGS